MQLQHLPLLWSQSSSTKNGLIETILLQSGGGINTAVSCNYFSIIRLACASFTTTNDLSNKRQRLYVDVVLLISLEPNYLCSHHIKSIVVIFSFMKLLHKMEEIGSNFPGDMPLNVCISQRPFQINKLHIRYLGIVVFVTVDTHKLSL